MSKYIPADKLIAEIERRIQRCEDCERDGYPDTTSSEATLKSLRSFIISLQQEQPEVDLEREIDNWLDGVVHTIRETARHFAEWGMSVMRERITNPDYNQKVIEKIKSEYPMDESKAKKEEGK